MGVKKDFIGYYITYRFDSIEGLESKAMIVIGENIESIANQLMKIFGEGELIYGGEKTIEEVMQSIENYLYEESSIGFHSLSANVWEMKPKNNVEFFKSEELLDLPSCLKMGRDHFIDFDSLI